MVVLEGLEHDFGGLIVRLEVEGAGTDEVRAGAPGIPCSLAGCLRIDRGIELAEHVEEGGVDLTELDREVCIIDHGEAGKRLRCAIEHFLAALDVDEGVGLGLLGKKTRERVLDIL